MSTPEPATRRPPPRLADNLSKLVGCVLVGWVIVYNILRVTGDTPSQAALPGFIVGGLLGLAAFAGGFVFVRRMVAAGRVVGRRPMSISGALDDQQRDAVRIAVSLLLGAAGIAVIAAVAEAVQWLGLSGDRPVGTLVFVAWNLVFAAWVADEAIRLRRSVIEGLDAVFFGCLLTAVLAGVAISRELLEPLQIVLALAAGMGALGTSLALWRLGGGRGVPVGMAVALVVTVLSLALPILL